MYQSPSSPGNVFATRREGEKISFPSMLEGIAGTGSRVTVLKSSSEVACLVIKLAAIEVREVSKRSKCGSIWSFGIDGGLVALY